MFDYFNFGNRYFNVQISTKEEILIQVPFRVYRVVINTISNGERQSDRAR